MKRLIFIIAISLAPISAALAQQINDPADIQNFVNTLTNQRNAAMDQLALSEARGKRVAEELNKANAQIKDMEAKAAPAKPDEAKPAAAPEPTVTPMPSLKEPGK